MSCFRTKVLLGVTDFRSIRDSTKSVFVITDRKIHPGYKKPAAYHDLAIAKLNRAIPQSFSEVGSNIYRLPLAQKNY